MTDIIVISCPVVHIEALKMHAFYSNKDALIWV